MAGQIEFVAHLTQLLGQTLKDKPVAAAYLYGSAAMGEMTPLSDVDIGLLIRGPLSLLGKLDLELSVEVEWASLGCAESVDYPASPHQRQEYGDDEAGSGLFGNLLEHPPLASSNANATVLTILWSYPRATDRLGGGKNSLTGRGARL
jgi:hypothetical protein